MLSQFLGAEVWEQLTGWFGFRNHLPWACSQAVEQGCCLIWRLDWGKIYFQTHSLMGLLVGLRCSLVVTRDFNFLLYGPLHRLPGGLHDMAGFSSSLYAIELMAESLALWASHKIAYNMATAFPQSKWKEREREWDLLKTHSLLQPNLGSGLSPPFCPIDHTDNSVQCGRGWHKTWRPGDGDYCHLGGWLAQYP